VNLACSAISWPWSQVNDRVSCRGNVVIAAASASRDQVRAVPFRQADEHQVAGGAFDQGCHGAHPATEE
jgi:hypothetical protein